MKNKFDDTNGTSDEKEIFVLRIQQYLYFDEKGTGDKNSIWG